MPSQIKIQPDRAITARTFPGGLAMIMMGGAILNIGKDILKIIKKERIPMTELDLLTEVRALILLLFFVLYALLMPVAGFMISSAIYSILMLFYFRVKDVKYYIIVISSAVIISLLFKNVLNVRLP